MLLTIIIRYLVVVIFMMITITLTMSIYVFMCAYLVQEADFATNFAASSNGPWRPGRVAVWQLLWCPCWTKHDESIGHLNIRCPDSKYHIILFWHLNMPAFNKIYLYILLIERDTKMWPQAAIAVDIGIPIMFFEPVLSFTFFEVWATKFDPCWP